MTLNNHPWSRDPVAQAAVRAAEDDAANWRRLEVGEVTQSGDEWCMGESAYGGLRWQCCTVGGTTILPHHSPCRRRRVPPPDHRELPQAVHDLRRRVEQLEACACAGLMQGLGDEPAVIPKSVSVSNAEVPENKGGTMPANGLRTERVTLEVTHCAKASITDIRWWHVRLNVDPLRGESVRVVEDSAEITRLTAERDAALRERDAAREEKAADWKAACESALAASKLVGTLKARVAELENDAAPAANAGGEANQPWPIAFAVWGRGTVCGVSVSREDAGAMQREFAFDTEVMPLFDAPQPPRRWLTEEEREAVVHAIEGLREASGRRNNTDARTLVSLLARETPPRVKAPASAWEASSRDAEWIAAIREAGIEVAE